MDEKTLERIGLTKGESKVYLALLELGQAATGPIVKSSGISTSKVYKVLDRLEQEGLVSHIVKNNVKYWAAASPKRVLDLLEIQEKELQKRKKETEAVLPQLMKRFETLKVTPQAETFVGFKGMATAFKDETEYLRKHPGETNYVIGVAREYPERIYDFFERLEKKRDSLKIKRKFLFGKDARGTMSFLEKSKYAKVRYLPQASIVSINIYGETAFISLFSREPVFFVIRSKEIADSFRDYFDILWKSAER